MGTLLDAKTGAVAGTFSASVIPAFTTTTGFFLSNGTLQGQAVSNNQVLWSFAGDGQLYALDATSGSQVWTQSLGAAIPASNEYGPLLYTGLAAGDGLLVVPNGNNVTAFTLSTSP